MTTFGSAIDDWRSHRARMVDLDLVRDSTWRNQAQIADTIKAKLGHLDIAGVRKSHVELYIGERLKTCAPVTVAGELNVLRQILNWAVDEQLLTERPRLPTVKVPATEESLPSDGAILWVLRWLPEQHGDALQFMMVMGLSPHELERVQTQDNAYQPGTQLEFTPPPMPVGLKIGYRASFKTKTPSRKRWVPMNDVAATIWAKRTLGTKPDHHPFPRRDATEKAIQRLRMTPIETTGGAYCPAGVEFVTPKTMRSWFASKVANDQPEHVLQRLLGHSPGSPITRRHYVRSTADQLAGAVQGVRA